MKTYRNNKKSSKLNKSKKRMNRYTRKRIGKRSYKNRKGGEYENNMSSNNYNPDYNNYNPSETVKAPIPFTNTTKIAANPNASYNGIVKPSSSSFGNNIDCSNMDISVITNLEELHKRYHSCCPKTLGFKSRKPICKKIEAKFNDIWREQNRDDDDDFDGYDKNPSRFPNFFKRNK